jgi:hypothetical protein
VRRRLPPRWAGVNVALAAAATLLAIAESQTPARPALMLAFVLVSPGLALVRLLRLGDRVAELTLVLALSAALAVLVPSVLLYADLWSPRAACAALLGIVLAATAVETARSQQAVER